MSDQNKIAPNDQAKTANPDLDNGPLANRGITDCLCCLLFIAACVFFVVVFSLGLSNGEPDKLFGLYDKSGKQCKIDYPDLPYLYFNVPYGDTSENFWFEENVCVSECPQFETIETVTDSDAEDIEIDCNTASGSSTDTCAHSECNYVDGVINYLALDQNSFCIYNTTKVLSRICWPVSSIVDSFTSESKDALNSVVNMDTLTQWFNDVSIAWPIIAASLGIAFALGVFYMLFIRIFSGVIVWLIIILYFAALIILGWLFYDKADEIAEEESAGTSDSASSTSNNEESYRYTGYVIWAIAGICFIGLLCLWNNIKLAIAIIKTATQFVVENPLANLVPVIFTILVGGFWVMWVYGAVYIYSYGEFEPYKDTPFASVSHTNEVSFYNWYFLFMGLWINAFIQAVGIFVLASTVCIWYFNHGGQNTHAPISTSIYRAFRYHLGTLAFGSLILAIVQLIRLILAYIQKQLEQSKASENSVVKFIIKCCSCYMECFERFIKFLTRHAYIQTALSGKNFCSAAKEAMRLLWANVTRATLVSGLGGAFIFVGKMFVSVVTVIICYLILTNSDSFSDMTSAFMPCLIIFVIGYAVAIIFMSVYGMAIDTILQCFLVDEEIQKGRGNAVPKHCPELLKQFFDENVKEAKK